MVEAQLALSLSHATDALALEKSLSLFSCEVPVTAVCSILFWLRTVREENAAREEKFYFSLASNASSLSCIGAYMYMNSKNSGSYPPPPLKRLLWGKQGQRQSTVWVGWDGEGDSGGTRYPGSASIPGCTPECSNCIPPSKYLEKKQWLVLPVFLVPFSI